MPQSTNTNQASAPAAIVLAAGKGTRMKSDLPKVIHEVGGRPMVCAVVDACLAAGCQRIVAVVGFKQELVRQALAGYGDKVEFAVQQEQLGTGHAVMSASGLFGSPVAGSVCFVLAGDGPLIRKQTLLAMLEAHRRTNAAATMATSILDDPTGYGRIYRDAKTNRFIAIVEQKNATPEQLKIREVYPSYACADVGLMFQTLRQTPRNEVTGEYYFTDLFGSLAQQGKHVEVVPAVPPEDVLSINTLEELAKVDAIYRSRTGMPHA
ncbi:MAG: NTP transferase domain-containing protein [Planctomycetota bacterium]|nr:NTP transferase domain-containing protein [Planctomycetota bacterium]